MVDVDAGIIEELERLRSMTSSDFIALAPLKDNAQRIRWKYALGSCNGRYQQMVIKKGQGLAGTTLRLGRWLKYNDTHPSDQLLQLDCPVMLAEELQSAAAYPIMKFPNSRIKGLLFMGKRSHSKYLQDELLAIHEQLHKLAWYLEENAGEIVK